MLRKQCAIPSCPIEGRTTGHTMLNRNFRSMCDSSMYIVQGPERCIVGQRCNESPQPLQRFTRIHHTHTRTHTYIQTYRTLENWETQKQETETHGETSRYNISGCFSDIIYLDVSLCFSKLLVVHICTYYVHIWTYVDIRDIMYIYGQQVIFVYGRTIFTIV